MTCQIVENFLKIIGLASIILINVLHSKNLQKVNQKDFRQVMKNYQKLDEYAQFYK